MQMRTCLRMNVGAVNNYNRKKDMNCPRYTGPIEDLL